MATYAAYRHIELDNVGYGKKRVLKPPGGGSSDIFGAADETSPRRIKNHNQSQLGSSFFGDGARSTGSSSPESPRANKPGNDSYKRLFGPPEIATQNTKNHMRSNISLSSDDQDSISSRTTKINGINGVRSNGNAVLNGNAITNDNTAFRRHKRFHGNPVTGAGYSDHINGAPGSQNSSSASSVNGDRSTTDSSPVSVNNKPARGRVPPGGFSSGLW